jgi:hypothetical protein
LRLARRVGDRGCRGTWPGSALGLLRALAVAALVTGSLTVWAPAAFAQPPPAATMVSPSGAITTTTPTYTWNAAGSGGTRATVYVLRVQTDFDNPPRNRVAVDDMRITAVQAACGRAAARECRAMGRTGGPGPHTWWIRACNAAGCGPWSGGLGFVRR